MIWTGLLNTKFKGVTVVIAAITTGRGAFLDSKERGRSLPMGPKHLCYSSLPLKIVFHHSSYSPLPHKLSFALPWKQNSQAPHARKSYCIKRLDFHMIYTKN
jgi:hypothetical protein